MIRPSSLKASLQPLVSGRVTIADDPGYEDATRTWDLSVNSRPPIALTADTVDDLAAAARWADGNGLGIVIRNTGHGAFSSDEGTLVISAAKLNRVEVDAASGRARVAPGARWTDVDTATAPLGMVGASGGAPGVGVVGYTLGGGLGPLGRTLGFAADRVTALTVLDADYAPLRVTAADDGDLFWALRGGGPLGIVTDLEFELAPLTSLFGGGVYFDGADARALLTSYAAWVATLDERTTTSIALIRLPAAPQLPPQLRGRYVVHLRIAHVDAASPDLEADGRALLSAMLATAAPIVDATRMMTPVDLPDIHRDPVAPLDVAYRGGLVDDLDLSAVTALVTAMDLDPAPQMIELRHLEGAYAGSPVAPSSATGRTARFNLYVTAGSTPAAAAATRELVDDTVARIATRAGAQLNFAGPAPRPGEILELWTEADAARLLAAADRLDPRGRIRTGRPLR